MFNISTAKLTNHLRLPSGRLNPYINKTKLNKFDSIFHDHIHHPKMRKSCFLKQGLLFYKCLFYRFFLSPQLHVSVNITTITHSGILFQFHYLDPVYDY